MFTTLSRFVLTGKISDRGPYLSEGVLIERLRDLEIETCIRKERDCIRRKRDTVLGTAGTAGGASHATREARQPPLLFKEGT